MVYYSSHREPSATAAPLAMSLLAAIATAAVAVYCSRSEVVDLIKKKVQVAMRTAQVSSSTATAINKKEGGRSRKRSKNSTRSKQTQQQEDEGEHPQEEQQQQAPLLPPGSFVATPIGQVRSIYRLCVGTPRQGLLAPNARGRIELTGNVDVVDGLEQFSHIWIVFLFHLNTTSSSCSNTTQQRKIPSKIAPPALGGKKVGVLATRSPHRGNPIGMTLCQLDSIDIVKNKKNKDSDKKFPTVILHISGLDLVDGTPVLDIKPFVPHYDSVPQGGAGLKVPSWVSGGLATKRQVVISEAARSELFSLLEVTPDALDFYGPHCGDESIDETIEELVPCIEQVLAVDVRSAWQTKKARGGKSQADRAKRVQNVIDKTTSAGGSSSASADSTSLTVVTSDSSSNESPAAALCTQQLDNLLIYYSLDKPEETDRDTSEGSGAEDIVTVHSFQLLAASKGGRRGNHNGYRSKAKKQEQEQLPVSPTISTNEQDFEHSTPGSRSRPYSFGAGHIVQFDKKPNNSPAPPLGGGYSVVQQYWNEVATVNTPKGVVPTKVVVPEKNNSRVPRELQRSGKNSFSKLPKSPSLPSLQGDSPPSTPTQQGRLRQELEDLVDDSSFQDALDGSVMSANDEEIATDS
jgi:tRNA-Thr(GGU) m(6)t(6)A37 methyltransferase TsaA